MFFRSGTGSGTIPALHYWSVTPDIQKPTLEYWQNIAWGETTSKLLVDAAGQCQWRQQKAARAVFDDAMRVLRPHIDRTRGPAQGMEVGDSRLLLTRTLPTETVQHWLHELRTYAAAFATVDTLDVSAHTPAPPWQIVQILGRELCRAPGVVLLHDIRRAQWHALYAVSSGCSKALNYPLRDMVLSGDTLLASAHTGRPFSGSYGAVAIDLHTHRLTRVEPAAD